MRNFAGFIFSAFMIALCLWGSVVGQDHRDKIQFEKWHSNEAKQHKILTKLSEIESQLNQCKGVK